MTKIEPIYQEVAHKIYKDENKTLPKVLKKIANLRQAKIMRELPATAEEFNKKLAPTTAEEIAKKLGFKKATVEKDLQYLFERGLVNSGRNGYNIVFASLIGLKDGVASANAKYDDNEVFDLLVQMSLEYPKSLPGRIKRGEKIPPVRQAMRVVPKWRTIKDIPGVLPIEDVREIFKDNPPIVVHRCPCTL
jgi:DNA-binding transcriptional ArsR family regulator